jgi:hypothetical protein
MNATPVPRHACRVGAPGDDWYEEILNTEIPFAGPDNLPVLNDAKLNAGAARVDAQDGGMAQESSGHPIAQSASMADPTEDSPRSSPATHPSSFWNRTIGRSNAECAQASILAEDNPLSSGRSPICVMDNRTLRL